MQSPLILTVLSRPLSLHVRVPHPVLGLAQPLSLAWPGPLRRTGKAPPAPEPLRGAMRTLGAAPPRRCSRCLRLHVGRSGADCTGQGRARPGLTWHRPEPPAPTVRCAKSSPPLRAANLGGPGTSRARSRAPTGLLFRDTDAQRRQGAVSPAAAREPGGRGGNSTVFTRARRVSAYRTYCN